MYIEHIEHIYERICFADRVFIVRNVCFIYVYEFSTEHKHSHCLCEF